MYIIVKRRERKGSNPNNHERSGGCRIMKKCGVIKEKKVAAPSAEVEVKKKYEALSHPEILKKKKFIVKVVCTQYATYRSEMRECGKPNCKRCPHGPYWYAYIRIPGKTNPDGSKDMSKIKAIYIGKEFKYLKNDQKNIVSQYRIRPDGSDELATE
jgi:hypothetical protein